MRTKNRIKARSGNEEKKRGLNQDQEVRKRRESKRPGSEDNKRGFKARSRNKDKKRVLKQDQGVRTRRKD